MITCIKCNFKVNNKMRFSIAKNFCPSCGSNLLSDATFSEINAINKKLQSQDFLINLSNQLNKDLVQNLIYDLSIFFKFELEKIYKTETSTQMQSEITPPSSQIEESHDSDVEERETSDEEERAKIPHKPIARSQMLSSIRDEVRKELEDDFDSEDDFEEDDDGEEVDERVARLKKVYETSPTLKKTFKGISRIGS